MVHFVISYEKVLFFRIIFIPVLYSFPSLFFDCEQNNLILYPGDRVSSSCINDTRSVLFDHWKRRKKYAGEILETISYILLFYSFRFAALKVLGPFQIAFTVLFRFPRVCRDISNSRTYLALRNGTRRSTSVRFSFSSSTSTIVSGCESKWRPSLHLKLC